MFCPKCGAKVEGNHSFCPLCGCSFEEWGYFSNNHSPTANHNQRGSRLWFYLILLVTIALLTWGAYSQYRSGEILSRLVKLQLADIQSNQITKAYYEHASTEYKKVRSFEKFKDFILKNSAFVTFQSFNVIKSEKEDKYGVVYGELLTSENMVVPVKYEFIREDEEWRILNISVEPPRLVDEVLEQTGSPVLGVVKGQLDALKSGDLRSAYEKYSAKEFQAVVNYETFREFIEKYPALTSDRLVNLSGVDKEGSQAKVVALFHKNGEPLPVEYILNYEGGLWKIWSMNILSPDAELSEEVTEAMVKPIDQFLDQLKSGKTKDAYNDTSSKFQEISSFQQFANFMKMFPIFSESEFTVVRSRMDEEFGEIRVRLSSDSEEAVVDYIVSNEGGEWKLMGIQLIETAAPLESVAKVKENSFDYSFLTEIINRQLNEIKVNDLYSAYENYTSDEFRDSTAFESFAKFVDQNVIFSKNSSMEFLDLSFDNNTATLRVNLTADNNDRSEVEYDLIKEGDEWKILGIKILNPNPIEEVKKTRKPEPLSMVFDKVDVGTKVNLSGQITNPSTKIKKSSEDIFATILLTDGIPGTKIAVTFEHKDTGSTLPPVEREIDNPGNSTISLVFSAPKEGWPLGVYHLKARASTGQIQNYTFEVIE